MTDKATARPWRLVELGKSVNIFGGNTRVCKIEFYNELTNDRKQADADLIVKAVNHHDEFASLLSRFVDHWDRTGGEQREKTEDFVRQSRALLAKVKS